MTTATLPGLDCPGCGEQAEAAEDGFVCLSCRRSYPNVAGVPDLRLRSDRYLDLPAERAKASRLAEIAETTNLEGVARAYYEMTDDVDPKRCRLFLRHILSASHRGEIIASRIDPNGSILDLGCGTGALTLALARRGCDVTGVDIASRWLIAARRRLDDAGVAAPLIAADAESLPWPADSFDTVVADSLIEHVDAPERALAEMFRVLRPGGRLLLWSPNRLSLLPDPHVRLWGVGHLPRRWAKAYVRLRRGGAWLPRCLSPREAATMIKAAGFVDVEAGFPALEAEEFEKLSARLSSLGRLPALPVFHSLASSFGPLWELKARKG